MTGRMSFLIFAILVLAGPRTSSQRTTNFNGFELVDKQGDVASRRLSRSLRIPWNIYSARSKRKPNARDLRHPRRRLPYYPEPGNFPEWRS